MPNYPTKTLRLLLDYSDEEPIKLLIPNFQREFIWERDSQKNLLASFLVGIPIGSLLFIQGGRYDFSAKELCYKIPKRNLDNIAEECFYLLDGQQRLSTLKAIFTDIYNANNDPAQIFEDIYTKLKTVWFLRLRPNENERDIWGYRWLYFDEENLFKEDPAEILPFLNYKVLRSKDKKNYFSPFYEFSQGETLDPIKREFADKYELPLYSLNKKPLPDESNRKILLDRVLDRIASNAMEELISSYDASEDKSKFLNELQENNLNAKEKEIDINSLDELWRNLRAEWKSSIKNYLTGTLLNQELPAILLNKDEIERATLIFDKVNQGGTPLSTFDLVVAKSFIARDEKSLRDRIREVLEENISIVNNNQSIEWNSSFIGALDDKKEDFHKEAKNQFLNILSIIANYKKEKSIDEIDVPHIKKKEILALTQSQINENYREAAESLKRTFLFLQKRCGIINIDNISYNLMILPIAFIFRKKENWDNKQILDKLEYWYWLSLFSGRYRESQNERCIEDIRDLYKWIMEGDEEVDNKINTTSTRFNNILNVEGYSNLSILLFEDLENDLKRSISEGIHQYVLSRAPYDLYTINPDKIKKRKLSVLSIIENGFNIEKHHIIPLSTASTIEKSSRDLRNDKNNYLNSPLNLTYISKEANSQIKSFSPSIYLKSIKQNFNDVPINQHFIPKDNELYEYLDEQTHRKFCEERFKLIQTAIQNELEELISSND